MEIKVINRRDDGFVYYAEIVELLLENLILNLPNNEWTLEDAKNQADNLLLNLENGSALLFIAVSANELLGFAWTYRRQIARQNRLHINHIIIKSTQRGEGIGTKLLDEIIGTAREMEMDAVDLMSSKDRNCVIKFYSERGFDIERLQMVYRLTKM